MAVFKAKEKRCLISPNQGDVAKPLIGGVT